MLPATHGFSRKLMSDLIFLFRFTSYGSVARTETFELISCDPSWSNAVQSRLTWVVRQVSEAHGVALHLVWEAVEDDADLHLLRDVLVLVGRSLKHDGDLPVHVCLGKLPFRLPYTTLEDDLNVICRSVTTHRATMIRKKWSFYRGACIQRDICKIY